MTTNQTIDGVLVSRELLTAMRKTCKLSIRQWDELNAAMETTQAAQPQPDPVLCKFYGVTDYPGLVCELVGHVAQLQDSAKRNVKPWEDTFPPTLLPAYIERVNTENAAAQPQGEPILIQAVAITRQNDDGMYLEWLLEGGICEMEFPGQVLFAMPEANDLCDEDGSAEIYIRPAEQPAPVAVVPDGWQMVPVEPTDDMIVAFAEGWYSKRQAIDDPDMLDAYRDMLVAAPAHLLQQ